jgi:hypothetical protein
MTYFSDFETTEYYYDDYSIRKDILRNAEDMWLEDSLETVPTDLLEGFEDVE